MITLDRVSLTAVGVGALFVFAGCAAPATDEAATDQTQAAMTAAGDEAFPEASQIDAPALPRAGLPVALATDVDEDTDVQDDAKDEAKDEATDEDDENVDSTSQGIFIGGFYPGFYGYRFGGFYPGFGLGYGWGFPGWGFGLGRAWGFRTGFIW